MEAKADVALQGCWSQPFLGEAALEKGDARAEVGQAVHPARDLFPTQYLWSKPKRSVVNSTKTSVEAMLSPFTPPPQQGEFPAAQNRKEHLLQSETAVIANVHTAA